MARARELRQEMPPAERLLWQELRGNKPGAHFRRQQVIAGFIVDFYCHRAGLVIELDGGIHRGGEQKEYDEQRDEVLRAAGLRVLRLRNEEVERELTAVLQRIRSLLQE